MKPGRVIAADEQEARERAAKIVEDAQAEAKRLLDDANVLANKLVGHARSDAERASAKLEHQTIEVAVVADIEAAVDAANREGRVDEVTGLVIRATVPGVALGEVVKIDRRDRGPLAAEVVGFRGEQAVLVPLGELAGIAPASAVWRTGAPLSIKCGDDLLGRVLDGIGEPVDGGAPLTGETWAIDRPAPAALSRPPITAPQPTGVRAIDTMLTLGRGQRVGLFAAAGVGKSTLLGQIARGAQADVVVHCQVGERGRELAELLDGELASVRARVVAVCATSDAPPLVRLRAVHVATAIAEWFRDRRGASVLLLVDSLTRVARAQREVGLSAGEPPARHGYPPSVFALLPRLIERAGATPDGVITALYTVLVAGNDHDEPIADEVRSLVDGHIVLDRRLAQRGHFPPIDVVASTSRLMQRVVDRAHVAAAARIRERLAIYEEHRDLITLGAYQTGRDKKIDDAVTSYPGIERALRQGRDEVADWDQAVAGLLTLARPH
ncbi:MAG: FliI/YscN family ATPase [Myxococcota bacterium]|nr:FliI/YscN family ATPase [Myxococcota bacterium]